MSDADKACCRMLALELRRIAARLTEISDGGFADMEGADGDDFFVAEHLYAGLAAAADHVTKTADFVCDAASK